MALFILIIVTLVTALLSDARHISPISPKSSLE